jgi:hypothetical protein
MSGDDLIADESEWHNLEVARRSLAGAEGRPSGLTDADRDAIAEARRLGPELRASTSDRDRLAGWLLKELADLAERLAAQITEASGG